MEKRENVSTGLGDQELAIMNRFGVPALVLAAALVIGSSTYAADVQRYRALGFASEGTVFVYELFSEFDGLGGGQSFYYGLDINKDRWVTGTPLGYRVGDGHPELEKIGLDEIRERAKVRAEPFLRSLGSLEPGVPVYVHALGDLREVTREIEFGFPSLVSAYQVFSRHSLKLETVDLENPSPESRTYLPTCKGLVLSLNGMEFYRDRRIPKSRFCPEDYRVAEIRWNPFTLNSVVLISVMFQGFEGKQREIIAIPMTAKWRQ